jgi:endonuclease YncB( thermonuclease family)
MIPRELSSLGVVLVLAACGCSDAVVGDGGSTAPVVVAAAAPPLPAKKPPAPQAGSARAAPKAAPVRNGEVVVPTLAPVQKRAAPGPIQEASLAREASRVSDAAPDLRLSATVMRVLDGDSFIAAMAGEERRVRLAGVRAARAGDARCTRLAGEATQALRQALAAGHVLIEPRGKDEYGRTLATVFVDGRDVSEGLARAGFVTSTVAAPPRGWCA